MDRLFSLFLGYLLASQFINYDLLNINKTMCEVLEVNNTEDSNSISNVCRNVCFNRITGDRRCASITEQVFNSNKKEFLGVFDRFYLLFRDIRQFFYDIIITNNRLYWNRMLGKYKYKWSYEDNVFWRQIVMKIWMGWQAVVNLLITSWYLYRRDVDTMS